MSRKPVQSLVVVVVVRQGMGPMVAALRQPYLRLAWWPPQLNWRLVQTVRWKLAKGEVVWQLQGMGHMLALLRLRPPLRLASKIPQMSWRPVQTVRWKLAKGEVVVVLQGMAHMVAVLRRPPLRLASQPPQSSWRPVQRSAGSPQSPPTSHH